jgi:hypothetical protein
VGGKLVEFDLLFSCSGGYYKAQVVRSPAGDGQQTLFASPFTELELENLILKMGRSRERARRVESVPVVAAKAAGGKMFEAVLSGPVGDCFRRSRDFSWSAQESLRINLRLSDCPELADLPWELLYDREEDWFLALSGMTPIIRYTQLSSQARNVELNLPLSILLIRSSPNDYPRLDLDSEFDHVSDSLKQLIDAGFVRITELASSSLGELRKALLRDTFHVLHYMGHGGFDHHSGGALLFTDSLGRGVPVSAADLGVMIHDHASMRLAVLNTCEGGRSDPHDPYAGVADTLVRRGIPAVVAMQFEITDRAAGEFAPALYGAIAMGKPVDVAVSEARKAIYAVSPLEWATPVLSLRARNAQLFEIPTSFSPLDGRLRESSVSDGWISTANRPQATGGREGIHPDNGGFQHYVDKKDFAKGIKYRKPITALCGWTWIPIGSDTSLPACPQCQLVYDRLPPG